MTFLIRRVRGIAFPLLGFLLFTLAANGVIDARLEPQFAGDSMMTRVRVVDFPRVAGATVSMLIAAIDDARIPARTRVTWFDPPRLPEFGDTWELEVRLRRPRGNSNPGLFSFEDWAFREKLGATGYVVGGPRNRLLEQDALTGLDAYRRNVVQRVEGPAGTALPVLAAISVGTRHLLSRADWDRYAKTGTSHLMAISGLHIGLAAAAAFTVFAFLSGVCRFRGNHLDQATLAGLATAAAYACISGFAVPSQRATITLALAAVAMLSRRRPIPARIVAMAAMAIFLADPVSSLTPGFNLSFAAVSLLVICSAIYARPLHGPACVGKPLAVMQQLVTLQLGLLLGLMPLTILYFQRVTLLAPLANLLAVPVFSLVTVPLALAGMAADPVSQAASTVLVRLSAASAGVIERIITGLASLPAADTFVAGVDGFDSAMLCVILLPALWVVLPRAWPGRPIALLAVLVLLLYNPPPPPRACIDAHVLDVGQGLAVVVQSRHHTLVYDTGASYRDGGSAAEQLVLPFFRYRRIRAIDWLIVSHADDDHAGGVHFMVRNIDIGLVFAGEVLADAGRDVTMCRAGQSWRADGVDYAIIHPPAGAGFAGNDASCVLAVSVGQHQLLLTGDIELAAERDLLAREAVSAAGVVLIPHHGSLTSSSPAFVNHLRPDIAIASVGHANRWGFPREPVVRRWQGAGARVLDTASSGAVSLRLCAGEGVSRVRQERQQRQRFWHDSPEH